MWAENLKSPAGFGRVARVLLCVCVCVSSMKIKSGVKSSRLCLPRVSEDGLLVDFLCADIFSSKKKKTTRENETKSKRNSIQQYRQQ